MKRFERSREDGTRWVICGRRPGRRLRRRLCGDGDGKTARKGGHDDDGGANGHPHPADDDSDSGRQRRTDRQDPDSLRRCLSDYSPDSANDDISRLFSRPVKQPKTIRRPSLHHPSNTLGAGNTCGPASTRL